MNVRFNVDAYRQQDLETKVKSMVALTAGGIISKNEARLPLGYRALDGEEFDEPQVNIATSGIGTAEKYWEKKGKADKV